MTPSQNKQCSELLDEIEDLRKELEQYQGEGNEIPKAGIEQQIDEALKEVDILQGGDGEDL